MNLLVDKPRAGRPPGRVGPVLRAGMGIVTLIVVAVVIGAFVGIEDL